MATHYTDAIALFAALFVATFLWIGTRAAARLADARTDRRRAADAPLRARIRNVVNRGGERL